MTTLRWITLIAAAAALLGATSVPPDQPKRTPELIQKGKASFQTNCVGCHGERGHGDGAATPADAKPRDFGEEPFEQGRKPSEVHTTLTKGTADGKMCSFAHLTEDELWALSYYVLVLRTSGKSD